jgi:acetylornithine deacetylase/succinyl-diaminopimelate desuccinylase-like protein
VEAPVLAALSAAHAAVCAAAPTVRGVPYGSDLRLFTNHADMPAVLYGPGDVALAHAVDEHISSAEVMRSAKVLALTVADWCQAR